MGSNVFTLLFVLGASASVLLVFANGGISRLEGLFLVLLYLPYIYSVYMDERRALKAVKKGVSRDIEKAVMKLALLFLVLLGSAEGVVRFGLNIARGPDVPLRP